MSYRRDDGVVERELEPYGLVLKAGVWYLVARVGPPEQGHGHTDGHGHGQGEDGGLRVYRVDRVVGAEASGERFERDPEVDLPGFWARHAEEFARSLLREEIVVRLSARGARRLPYVTDRTAAREALAAADGADWRGRVTVTLPVEGLDVAHDQLLALGADVEVLGPESLRERFFSTAERLGELYS